MLTFPIDVIRRKVTIGGVKGAETDYHVPLRVGESAGSPDCDFHVDSHALKFPSSIDDSGDICFTNKDVTKLLEIEIEPVKGITPNRTVTIWVKVSDNLDNDVDIYCYYHNINLIKGA